MTTGKMKKIFFICLTLAALVACKEKPQQKPNGDIAGKAAVEYYGYLQRHNFSAYVDGMYYEKPIPKEYKALLVKNAEMFVHEQDSLHHGIKAVKLSKADMMQKDTTLVAAYLTLTMGDGTSEEVLVPMVKRKNVWYMK